MRNATWLMLSALACGVSWAQMPSSFDASGRSAQSESGVQQGDAGSGQPAGPQLFGMELPLLDPSTDTMTYNGSKIDVGNNAVVRARFEKYLNQKPDESAQSKVYRSQINKILKETQRYVRGGKAPGSQVLVNIGRTLYDIADYPGDGGQAAALASAIVSALDAQRANYARDKESEALDKEIEDLVKKTNSLQNQNTQKGSGAGAGAIKPAAQKGGSSTFRSNEFRIAHNTSKIAENKGLKVKNDATNAANLLATKTAYQSMMVSFLAQRRYDHALIASRIYRHVFRDGDTKLNLKEDSDLNKTFEGIGGLPPTVAVLDQAASNARREVDQNMEAVHSLLAQNKLSEATQHLIEAVAVGEYMQSVTTFSEENRRRIAEFWSLRKKALTTMNHRDYGQLEEIANRMKSLDADFDDSLLRSYCAGRKRESDLHVRNAMKAMQAGDETKFNEEIRLAGEVWPLNPNLDAGAKKLEEFDNMDPLKDDFRDLYSRKQYRTIYDERDKFKVVAIDKELEKQYMETIEFVASIDAMLVQLGELSRQDRMLGACMAYEKMIEFRNKDARYADDLKFNQALNEYRAQAHDFVQALVDAEECDKKREFGSALSCYHHALCLYPASRLAEEGVRRVSELILDGEYDGGIPAKAEGPAGGTGGAGGAAD